MLENSIEKLFRAIEESAEYLEYKEITSILKENKELNDLIDEIKSLEKEATNLEYHKDIKYKEIDKLIAEKVQILNNNAIYREYLEKLKRFNDTLKVSSALIEEYIDEKVSI